MEKNKRNWEDSGLGSIKREIKAFLQISTKIPIKISRDKTFFSV